MNHKALFFTCCLMNYSFHFLLQGQLSQSPIPPSLNTSPVENSIQINSTIPEMPYAERIRTVLDFWFGPLPDPEFFPAAKVPVWFSISPETNRQLREQFLPDVLLARQGKLNQWRETPRGRLALILLLDLFARHIYRNSAQAFMSDSMAKGLAIEGIQAGDDQALYPIERAFFYLPLEHAENPIAQAQSVTLYQQLLSQAPVGLHEVMQDFYYSAVLHQQQILRFGRFPHRNSLLKRQSTPEEVVFLMQWKRKGIF
jgi:uncharacterized protein (DUF924 family)